MSQIGPVTVEILLAKSLCGGWWWVVCKPILVFSLSLGQAEQKKIAYTFTLRPLHLDLGPSDQVQDVQREREDANFGQVYIHQITYSNF